MKQFMDKDFLLETETAQKLLHEYADQMPIVDITAISIHRKSLKIVSLRISHRYG